MGDEKVQFDFFPGRSGIGTIRNPNLEKACFNRVEFDLFNIFTHFHLRYNSILIPSLNTCLLANNNKNKRFLLKPASCFVSHRIAIHSLYYLLYI